MSLPDARLAGRHELEGLDEPSRPAPPQWLRPGAGRWAQRPGQGGVVILNNIVTPYSNRLFNAVVEAGVGLTVVSAAAGEPNRSWGEPGRQSYRHVVLPGLRLRLGPGRFAYLNRGVFRTLGALRPRLLVINGFYPTMLLAVLWAMLTRTRLMLSIDGWAETMPNSLYHRIVRPLVLRRCERVITPGRKGRDYFRAQGIADDRIVRVPLVPAWDAPAESPPFAERPFDLVSCGHLNDAAKNAGFLVAFCRELVPMRPGLRVRIVGQGPAQQETLAALQALGIDVVHDSSLPWDRMAEVFSAAKLLVFPSLWEPWGLVCNEAMQCGTPALVSPHVGAGGDLVRTGETGAVLPLDARLWAAEVLRLLTDADAWQSLSAQARAEMAGRSLAASAGALAEVMA